MSASSGWSLFWRQGKHCWVLKYKSVDGWAQKHLPADIAREDGPRPKKKGKPTRQLQMPLTRAEVWAKEWLENAESLKLRPRMRSGGLILRDAAEQWKAMRRADDALTSPATVRRFACDLRNVVLPFKDGHAPRSLGDEDVVSLATDLALLRRWFRSLVARLSPWRARSAFSTLRSFFDDALVEKWFRGVNPMKNEALVRELPPPPNKADRGGVVVVETELVQRLITDPRVPLGRATRYVLAATMGKREGESAGLSWDAVHLDAPTPHIDVVRARRLIRRKGEERGPLKTPTSRGVLPLHPAAAAALREWRDDLDGGVALVLGRPPRGSDPVFPSERLGPRGGGFTRPRSAEKLREDLRAAELPDVDPKGRNIDMHALRKSFATWLRRLKVADPIRKALMRHGAHDVTEDFYTEDLPEMAEGVQRIPLKWCVVARVVPTLVSGGTKGAGNLSHNAEPRVGLEPTTCALRKHSRQPADGGDALASVTKGALPPAQDSTRESGNGRADRAPAALGTKPRPGVARVAKGAVGVRLEVDGAELASTTVAPGEPVADVEARLKLAVGQKGGLR